MIRGIGIDLIEKSRFSEVSEEFLGQIFNPCEIESVKKNSLYAALKFVLKEAILKAIGIGLYFGFFWKEINIINNNVGIKEGIRKYIPDKSYICTGTGSSKKYACAIAIINDNEEVD